MCRYLCVWLPESLLDVLNEWLASMLEHFLRSTIAKAPSEPFSILKQAVSYIFCLFVYGKGVTDLRESITLSVNIFSISHFNRYMYISHCNFDSYAPVYLVKCFC